MSLESLSYKYIGKFNAPAASVSGNMAAIATAFSSTTYSDGTSRVTGSGIAWTPYSQISTGTTIGVALTPVTSTLGQKIVYAGGAAGTPTMLSPDSYANTRINFGLCKNAGSYSSWADANPFTTGEFSGYSGFLVGTSVAAIHAYESKDSVVILGETAAGALYMSLAGAIYDPESSNASNAESDGKLYGLVTSGYTNTGVIAHSSQGTATLFSHNASAGSAHFYVMNVGLSTTLNVARLFNMLTNPDNVALKNIANEFVRLPIHISRATNGQYVGRLREIFFFPNGTSITKFVVSGVTNGFVIGTSTASTSNTILLKA